ncbi:hypothetical protein [Dactylosporangium sp. CA-092794]|uniref:hypothetical protein n=1 Tax=Dactylosporangium sp. CA-092794 TaxID=3239929 RepID=UPI003D9335D9
MFFRPRVLRLLPRYRRLMRDGARAKAVVVESRAWYGSAGPVALNARLRLEVRFPDGAGATVSRVVRYRDLGDQDVVGSILPMRYEPGDRSYVEVDLPELRRSYSARMAKLDRAAVREARAKLRRPGK